MKIRRLDIHIRLLLLCTFWLWSGNLYAQVEQDSIRAFRLEEDTIKMELPDSLKNTVTYKPKERWRPNPKRAMWMALVIPGGGQIYNHKYWKLPIFYGGFVGCAYALTWNNMMYKDYSQAYLDIMDDDPNTKSYEAWLPYGVKITPANEKRYQEILKKKKDYYRKYRDLSVFSFIGVYLLSVVDAYVDAELSSFDINEDLSLKIEPTIINHTNGPHSFIGGDNAYGVQCRLTF